MRFLIAIGALTLASCDKHSDAIKQSPEHQEAPWDESHPLASLFSSGEAIYIAPADSIAELLEANDLFTFVSRQGQLAGMDSDTAIIFRSDGTVTLSEMGMGSNDYSGKVVIQPDGIIDLHLPRYPGKWPSMRFERVGDSCFLHRVDGKTGFVFGGRSGAVTSGDMNPFWPFALLDHEFPRRLQPKDQ
ncbi:hypothetical protein HAHE_26010 [Haloferula helveola]|uniref:Uncharacterized protein n=1 Tax=Haloferula helveola TaxID=490095 RepID=A0ABM7RB14_9BACT|nr:hypothetical protein HAHE_24410 [Haloferula helveola]BCX48693.1 hypothetical protein HAHE_26010 [Haloferula helveola]